MFLLPDRDISKLALVWRARMGRLKWIKKAPC
jgi:hypothetical protein